MTFETQPRAETGRWSAYLHSDAEATLLESDEPLVATILIDGQEVRVYGEPFTDDKRADPTFQQFYEVIGAPYSDTFLVAAKQAEDQEHLEQLATMAYNAIRVQDLISKRGAVASLDAQLENEIARLAQTISGLRAPNDWKGEYPLRPASSLAGNRLDSDDTYARCDYAEVGDEGIAYGYRFGDALLGEILAGEQQDGESLSEYESRVEDATTSETRGIVEKFFTEEFGADVVDDGDSWRFAAEFYVPFPAEGASGTSIEYMGDLVEKDTKLLALRNSYEYGGRVQSDLAAALGYRYDHETRGYVKDDDTA